MKSFQVYEKVLAETKRTGKPVREVCRKMRVPLWKYYDGRKQVLGIKRTKKKSTSVVIPESNTGTGKVVLVMGTPDQIRSMLG